MHAESGRIVANLARVRQQIAAAAQRSGRAAGDVTLLAVTKYVSPAVTASLVAAGCFDMGESRPQDLWAKAAELNDGRIRWHLIGHLQRNKLRRTLPLVELVHSVDSERLLEAIDREAALSGRVAQVLLEANISGDATKTGLPPEALPALLARAGQLAHVQVRGLMGMASLVGGLTTARRDFAHLRQLRDRLAADGPPRVSLTELSMGMSGDFEVAIEEGATIVRVGSALFEGIDE
jgi:pyridoxal phosphate enzyme (YggS family)